MRVKEQALSAAADIFDPPPWEPEDREPLEPHQEPPDELVAGEVDWWLLEGGRGSGKTEACARYFAKYMEENPGHRGTIIAPTFGDAVESCIVGVSGLQAIDPSIKWLPSAPGGAKVVWPNGSQALVIGTPFPKDVDRLRAGGNRHIFWWEEAAANAQLKRAVEVGEFGLRLGDHPHNIGSTTPRNTSDYREIRGREGVVRTHATMFDNPHNPKGWVERMRKRYEGTRLGRQELQGELLDDVEGALWNRKMFEACRVESHPDLVRIGVAIDPAASSTPDADDTGIMVGGVGVDGHGYLLADRTCHLGPEGWAKRALRALDLVEGDVIIGEKNNGGDMVEANIRAQAQLSGREPPSYKGVWASRGKLTRAEPISSLYGSLDAKKREPRIHHVGMFAELEDECCTYVPGESDSPNRMDALVWLFTELMLEKKGSWHPL